jgi:hypothetical protein
MAILGFLLYLFCAVSAIAEQNISLDASPFKNNFLVSAENHNAEDQCRCPAPIIARIAANPSQALILSIRFSLRQIADSVMSALIDSQRENFQLHESIDRRAPFSDSDF